MAWCPALRASSPRSARCRRRGLRQVRSTSSVGIEAERGAIEHYTGIIEATEGVDLVTQDMVTSVLHDELGHMWLFEGYLREYEVLGIA